MAEALLTWLDAGVRAALFAKRKLEQAMFARALRAITQSSLTGAGNVAVHPLFAAYVKRRLT
ncbi:hypothetical protein [Alicyclobacillus acidocaldarius]|uniref:Uncharacterized protein n=1 Tax=Alicyclobacillus acidocaldarius (strain Tc-4-1) TaxID=1048834 RepID=F8IIZ9_ALIAT|nr:hypothetical protein [Alicyclobacillus acidocaldarius]AEJ42150.1 hypothetical protein TC41_0172 [Alicyclobacillus acidocaldarius subsp. acidocaldarius Tc-4-1]